MVPSRNATSVRPEVPKVVELWCRTCNRFYWDNGVTTEHFCNPSRGPMCSKCGEWPRDIEHECRLE